MPLRGQGTLVRLGRPFSRIDFGGGPTEGSDAQANLQTYSDTQTGLDQPGDTGRVGLAADHRSLGTYCPCPRTGADSYPRGGLQCSPTPPVTAGVERSLTTRSTATSWRRPNEQERSRWLPCTWPRAAVHSTSSSNRRHPSPMMWPSSSRRRPTSGWRRRVPLPPTIHMSVVATPEMEERTASTASWNTLSGGTSRPTRTFPGLCHYRTYMRGLLST